MTIKEQSIGAAGCASLVALGPCIGQLEQSPGNSAQLSGQVSSERQQNGLRSEPEARFRQSGLPHKQIDTSKIRQGPASATWPIESLGVTRALRQETSHPGQKQVGPVMGPNCDRTFSPIGNPVVGPRTSVSGLQHALSSHADNAASRTQGRGTLEPPSAGMTVVDRFTLVRCR